MMYKRIVSYALNRPQSYQECPFIHGLIQASSISDTYAAVQLLFPSKESVHIGR